MKILVVCIFLSSVSSLNISPCEDIPRSECRNLPDCYVEGSKCKVDDCYDEFAMGWNINCSKPGCSVYNITTLFSITTYALCVKTSKRVKNKCFPYGCITLFGMSACSKGSCETTTGCLWVEQNLESSEEYGPETFGYCNGTFDPVDPEPIIFTASGYGTDKEGCGAKDGPNACATVAFAITQRTGYRVVQLYGGDYSETKGMVVNGEVEIKGASRDGCFLSKIGTDFTLFTMFNVGRTDFSISSVTILLNNISQTAKFLCVGDSNNMVDASVFFQNCSIIQEEGVVTHGAAFLCYSDKATLAFYDCTLANIVTDDTYPILYCPSVRLFEMTRCTVDAVFGLNRNTNSSEGARSGLFFLSRVVEFHLVNSTFKQCVGTVGGVGAVDRLAWTGDTEAENSTVKSCTFERVYASTFGGALSISGNGVDGTGQGRYTRVVFTNSSFRNASTSATSEEGVESLEGGALAFRQYIVAEVNDCLFQGCHAARGGALHARQGAEVTVDATRISACTASLVGGAVAVEMGRLTMRNDTKLIGNSAKEGPNLYVTDDDKNYESRLTLSATCSDRLTSSIHTAGRVIMTVNYPGDDKLLLPLCPVPLCGFGYSFRDVVNMLAKKKERGDE